MHLLYDEQKLVDRQRYIEQFSKEAKKEKSK